MKKIVFVFLSIFLITLFVNQAQAAVTPTSSAVTSASVTPKASPTKSEPAQTITAKDEKLNDQINELKEKIASRVSELKLVEKRAIIGTVSEVSANKISLSDLAGKTRFVDVDEITKFSSSTAKNSFGLSDLTKGTKISVLGIYNKQSKRILARFIEVTANPKFLSGTVSEMDTKNFVLTLMSENDKSIKIDIQTTTKILTYDKEDGLSKYGFSKIEVGDRVSVIGFPSKTDSSMIIGTRVIDFTDLPKNPSIIIKKPTPTVAEEEDIIPSTGSGKKLTPIKN